MCMVYEGTYIPVYEWFSVDIHSPGLPVGAFWSPSNPLQLSEQLLHPPPISLVLIMTCSGSEPSIPNMVVYVVYRVQLNGFTTWWVVHGFKVTPSDSSFNISIILPVSGPPGGVITRRTVSDRILCMTLSKIPVSDYNSSGYGQIWTLMEVPNPPTICGEIYVNFG